MVHNLLRFYVSNLLSPADVVLGLNCEVIVSIDEKLDSVFIVNLIT